MKRPSYRKLCAVGLVVACGSDIGPIVPVASVTVTPASAPLAAGATLQLSAAPKDANGTVLSGRTITWTTSAPTFATVNGTGLVSGLSPGPVTITATSEGKSGSADITVSPGPAVRLAFVVQPATTSAGSPVSPAVQVSARDALGNTATSFTGAIAIGIGMNPGGGTLTGTTSVAAVAGTATFTDLRIDKAGTGYTLAATAAGLSGATSSAFTVISGSVSASQSSLNALPRTITASLGASSATITVMALDGQGNPVAGAVVQLAATGAGNTLTQPAGPTDAAGIATGTLSSTLVGAKIVSATVAGVALAETDTVTVRPGPAAGLFFTVHPSNAVAGSPIAPAIEVTARDAFANDDTAFTGSVTVSLASNPGNATLSGTLTRSAVGGVVSFDDLSLDRTGTGYTLQATASGLTAANSNAFTISAAGPDHLGFLVQPADVVAGATMAAVQVEVRDASGNRVPNATNSIAISISDNPSGGTLSGTTTVAAVGGVATFSTLNIDLAGSGYTLAAAATGLGGTISGEFDVTPGSPSRLTFFVEPTTAPAGSPLAPALQIEIEDAFGNRVPTATNAVTVSIATNPGGGSLSGTQTRSAVAGVATFNDLSIDMAAVGYRLRATAGGLTPDTSVAFTIIPGAATQLVFTTQPSTTVATAAITPAVQVAAQDGLGNTATSFSGNVTLALGTDPCGGTLSGATTMAATAGVATFSSLSIERACGGYTLAATATGLGGAVSSAFSVIVGPAAALAFLVQPSGTTGGAIIAPPVQVEIQDAGGNRVTSATSSVTVAIADNPGGGTLAGNTSVSAVNGVASFADLSINRAGAGYTLAASAAGLAGATSAGFTVAVGNAAKLAFLVQPSNTEGGAILAPAVQVEVQDAGGNRVTTGAHMITVAIGNNPGSGTLSGTTLVTSASGVASFGDLSIDNAGTGYTLTASATGVTSATSIGFDIVVGSAAQLAFFVQPSNTTGGTAISPAVAVEIQDAGGNRVNGASNSVTVTIGTNPNNGSLSGTTTVPAVNGLATLGNLIIDSAGTGYTLGASASGLTGATSAAFTVTVGAAAGLGFRVQPSNTSGGAIIMPAVQVEVRDAGGNRVGSATHSVTITIATNPNAGTLSGTTTSAAVAGLATFGTLRIDSAGAGYRLGAAAAGLAPATSNTFTITVGAAARLGFLVQPSDAQAGAAITPAVRVEVRDAGGNRVTTGTHSVTLSLATNPGGSTLSGTNPVSSVSGVATFGNLSLNRTGTGYALQATAPSLTAATSASFTISADGVDPAQSSVAAATDTIGQCAYSCTPGILASSITVTVRDQFGNLVSGSPIVLSANGSGNGFSPSATGNTDANGVFTAAFNAAVAENKTISAVAGGVPITQTATTAVMPALVGAGDIADCNSIRDDATATLLDSIPGVVFAAGDLAYPNGTAANFTNCYEPTWGRHKARTRPVVGNHEYDSSGTAAPYTAYFGTSVADPEGNGFGYYSFELGAWHIIVLNSDSGVTSPASGQLTWLQNDLIARTNQCVLAIWHRPLFTSGSSGGGQARIRRLWQALQNGGAEVVINGHDHLYERFALQDSLGTASPSGIREFIVGTGGGESHSQYVNNPPNVEASDQNNFSRGVLRLILYPGSYRWDFRPAQGQGTYTDSGTSSCH